MKRSPPPWGARRAAPSLEGRPGKRAQQSRPAAQRPSPFEARPRGRAPQGDGSGAWLAVAPRTVARFVLGGAKRRLEGWPRVRCLLPSFETRAFGPLLRMRVDV